MKSMIAVVAALAMMTSVATAQFPEGFETATTGTATCGTTNPGVFPLGWISAGNNPFLVDNNGTGSTGTGPTAANTGTNYIHIETSCSTGTWVGELEIPLIAASGLTNPTLEFAYHMWGAEMGRLEVQVDIAGTWVTVWFLTGDQGNMWSVGQANIASGIDGAGNIRARFVGTRGAGFTSDIALDDVDVTDPANPVPLITAPYQTNSAEATTDINGVMTDGYTPAVATFTTAATATLNIDGTAGVPYEVLVAAGPVIPSGTFPAVATPGGQIVNVDWTSPVQFWLNGGASLLPVPLPGPIALNFNVPLPATAAAQGLFLDPTSTEGFRLSQATQLAVIDCGPGMDLGLTDDSNSVAALGFNFNFYGTAYTEIYVSSNGNIGFGSGDSGWASGTTALQTDARASISAWGEDFNPSVAGVVNFDANAASGTFTVTWCQVPSFGTTNSNTFTCVGIDTGTSGSVQVTYDAGSGETEGTIGLSPGSALAGTTVIPVDFSTVGGGLPIGPLDIVAEDFTNAGTTFDLLGTTLTWFLDATGTPTSVQ